MRYVFTVVFFIILTSGFAQRFSSEVFHEGFLVTTSKDTLKGNLKYDLEANIVTIFSKGKTHSFSSQKTFFFEIFDIFFG